MKYTYLTDLIEDTRHAAMKLRRYLTKRDCAQLATSPRVLVDAANRQAQAEAQESAEDQMELELANYLIGQYEEALTFLGSMFQE